jgi:dTDP-4-amino-4,6-dideoxygalactose transaminase
MAIQVFQATFNEDECLKEIKECLDKGWTGMGFKTVEFEEDWKKYTGLSNAYFINSETAGLNLCFAILKLENHWDDDSEVISTPLTFISSNTSILKAGLKVVFADVDDTFCLDPKSVEKHITKKTVAIEFVGVGGNIGNYYKIVEICKKYHLKLILDAAHMAGTRVNGIIPGAESDCVLYSFQAVKNLPTGDSGMICFKEAKYDSIARKMGWCGINKDTYSRVGKEGNYKWKYDVEYLGNKYNGNSIMAAIGIAQLKELDKGNAYRAKLVKWYREYLEELGRKITFVNIPSNCDSSNHLFQILVEKRDELMEFLNSKDIFPGVHYVPNTEYKMFAYAKGTCPRADYIGAHTITLPVHLRVTHDDVILICDYIKEFLNN